MRLGAPIDPPTRQNHLTIDLRLRLVGLGHDPVEEVAFAAAAASAAFAAA